MNAKWRMDSWLLASLMVLVGVCGVGIPEAEALRQGYGYQSVRITRNGRSQWLHTFEKCKPGTATKQTNTMITIKGKRIKKYICEQCPANYYSANGRRCKPCRSGYFSGRGYNKCLPCQKGTYTTYKRFRKNWSSSKAWCQPCKAGTYNNKKAMGHTPFVSIKSICKPCPKGTFSGPHASSCQPCPKGRYNNRVGQKQCSKCPKGKRNNTMGQLSCSLCPKGRYCHRRGMKFGKNCPKGTYNDRTGRSGPWQCRKCPKGTYNAKKGAKSELKCKKCPRNTYASAPGALSCLPCPTGTSAPGLGNFRCMGRSISGQGSLGTRRR